MSHAPAPPQHLASGSAAAASMVAPRQLRRIVATLIALPALAVLTIAAFVTPDAAGYGTHTQLGLPPCGFELATGLPCATCGMTTAFAHAADGNFVASFLTQPAGFVLAVLTAVTAIVATYIAITGADPRPLKSLFSAKLVLLGGAILVGGWIYKIVVTLGSAG
ncbi:MAG: DUF2752 domain-containing protein [Planctomycetota bacterium]